MDSVLRKKCLKVENIDETLVTLADDMIETMYDARGIGLAGLERARALGVEREALEHRQALQEDDPARGGRRHAQHFVAAEPAHQGRAPLDPVVA